MPSSDTTELTITSPSEWKGVAKEGVPVPLPSGNVVRIKRTMDLFHLLKAGKIPNPLAAIVTKMINTGEMPPQNELGDGAILDMLKLIDKTVVSSVTEPVVESPPDPEPNESDEDFAERVRAWEPSGPNVLPLTHIDLGDRMYIFQFAQGMAADLISFREEQEADVASLANEQAAKKPSKRASKSR